MSVTTFIPKYSQPVLSVDEMETRAIADLLDSGTPLPQKCGTCGRAAAPDNLLVMRPLSRMEHGGPRGTLYRTFCASCLLRRR